jgi:three-Cys-motif partner protein
MAKKEYDWEGGAVLDEHSKKKHQVLREYFRAYLKTRCSNNPHQTQFKLAVIDGFSGGGIYKNGHQGSPLIFMQTLMEESEKINLKRKIENLPPIEIGCLFIFNDKKKNTIRLLEENVAPFQAKIKDDYPKLKIQIEYKNKKFNDLYDEIKAYINSQQISNVIFVLDQYGHAKVKPESISDILSTWRSAEVFLTFSIEALKAYLSPDSLTNLKNFPDVKKEIEALLKGEQNMISKASFLGHVEKALYQDMKSRAPYLSPFSINNPQGWRYWLLHFANSYRAREVYNNVLHDNSEAQSHVGRPGLEMLSYDPKFDDSLYLFNHEGREKSTNALHKDIPDLIIQNGDIMEVGEFYRVIYSDTPAHSDDIRKVLIDCGDIKIITENGGERRTPNTIKPTDIIKIEPQASFFNLGEWKPKK